MSGCATLEGVSWAMVEIAHGCDEYDVACEAVGGLRSLGGAAHSLLQVT